MFLKLKRADANHEQLKEAYNMQIEDLKCQMRSELNLLREENDKYIDKASFILMSKKINSAFHLMSNDFLSNLDKKIGKWFRIDENNEREKNSKI